MSAAACAAPPTDPRLPPASRWGADAPSACGPNAPGQKCQQDARLVPELGRERARREVSAPPPAA
jgi:hypothetical protein